MIIKSVLLNRKRYHLVDENVDSNNNVYTAIIGINGSGKSRLLHRIIDSTMKVKVKIDYSLDKIPAYFTNHIETINYSKLINIYSRLNSKYSLLGDTNKQISQVKLNTKLIAATTSPFDKFPVENKVSSTYKCHEDDLYNYIGLRVSKNSYNKSNFINLFVRSFLKNGITDKQRSVFSLLKYRDYFFINFKTKFSSSEEEDLGFSEYSQGYRKGPLTFSYFLELLEKRYYTLFRNIKENKDLLQDIYQTILACCQGLVNGITSTTELHHEKRQMLILLLDLGIIQIKKISLVNNEGDLINLSEASSGEQCILLTLLNISGVIKDNSVICIDEPEISLHPHWQKEFMPMLMYCFRGFKHCHFIVATHSPLIISTMRGTNSFILNMENTKSILAEKFVQKSVDYQLAELFHSPGDNNEYLNRIVVSLLSSLSRNGKLNKAQRSQSKMLFNLCNTLNEGDIVKELIAVLKDAMEKLKK